MEEITSTIRKSLKALIEKCNEPEMVKSLAELEGQCDIADKSYQDLESKHAELKKDYSDQIKAGIFKEKASDENTHEVHEEISLEGLAQDLLEKQN